MFPEPIEAMIAMLSANLMPLMLNCLGPISCAILAVRLPLG